MVPFFFIFFVTGLRPKLKKNEGRFHSFLILAEQKTPLVQRGFVSEFKIRTFFP